MPKRPSPSRRIAVLIDAGRWRRLLPGAGARVREGVGAALAISAEAGSVRVLLTDDARLRALNHDFRGADRPTNVLAFPSEVEPLGDIAVALETCVAEAAAQDKALGDHLSHLVVHATLHLLGHDHGRAPAARKMEALERRILSGLGIADPYRSGAGAGA